MNKITEIKESLTNLQNTSKNIRMLDALHKLIKNLHLIPEEEVEQLTENL